MGHRLHPQSPGLELALVVIVTPQLREGLLHVEGTRGADLSLHLRVRSIRVRTPHAWAADAKHVGANFFASRSVRAPTYVPEKTPLRLTRCLSQCLPGRLAGPPLRSSVVFIRVLFEQLTNSGAP